MKQKQLIREKFSTQVFQRDGYKCVFCERKDNLDAHHITDRNEMPNGGYVRENGITLCPEHHLQAEQYHISGGQIWSQHMHPNDLYKRIGSSYDLAVQKSLKLGFHPNGK